MSERSKVIQAAGKRKTAIARGILRYPSKGQIIINNVPLELYEPEIARMRIQEVLEVIGHPKLDKCNINIKVEGGGKIGQTDATRIAIAKLMNKFLGTKSMEKTLREYDESLLSGDSRRTEPKHFGGRKARKRKQKSFR
jgi:small subunit ribosomal protein S9